MTAAHFVSGTLPERFVEVDAARLLLILVRFGAPPGDESRALDCFPSGMCALHFATGYRLQKLDFLLRYPAYLAYELAELHRLAVPATADRVAVAQAVRNILASNGPEESTIPFRKFWHGAYERLDDAEALWMSKDLVWVDFERHGQGRRWKHYFVRPLGVDFAARLVAEVPAARWYDERLALIQRFMGGLSAADLRTLQYQHEPYRQAQLGEYIPDLDPGLLARHVQQVLDVTMEVPVG
jgi:hypothetical protein